MTDAPAKPAPASRGLAAPALAAADALEAAGRTAEADAFRELAAANDRLIRARRPERKPGLRAPRMELFDG